jgi:protein TonB
MGPGQGRGSGPGSPLQGYLKEVRQLLEKQKDYPLMARRRQLQGIVVLRFIISCGGQIESSQVSRASGHAILDEAARDTIRRVGRFPPFPADLNRQELTIEIPLAFRLSKD